MTPFYRVPRSAIPTVSVVVPWLVLEAPLSTIAESVIPQTYPHWEVVVAYPAGWSDVQPALTALEQAFRASAPQRLIWEVIPSATPGAAWNAAIRRSKGSLIALLHPGDVWPADRLERCREYLQVHPEVDVLYSPAEPSGRTGNHGVWPEGWILSDLFAANPIADSTAVFDRRVWERLGGFDESLTGAVSHHFWLKAAVCHRFGLLSAAPVRLAPCGSPTRDELIATARMLYQFYEQQGGNERIERTWAHRVLARACLQAGWACMQAGDGTLAELAFRVARWYRPSVLAWLGFLMATTQRRWLRQPVYQPPAS